MFTIFTRFQNSEASNVFVRKHLETLQLVEQIRNFHIIKIRRKSNQKSVLHWIITYLMRIQISLKANKSKQEKKSITEKKTYNQ